MPTEEKFTENKTKDKVLDVLCIECNRLTQHRVTALLDKDGCEYNKQEGWGVEWADHYQIVQCLGCKSVTFRHSDWFSEAMDWG